MKKLFPPIMVHDPPGERTDDLLEAGLGFRLAVLVESTGAFDIARQFLHLGGELLQRLRQGAVEGGLESLPGSPDERAAFDVLRLLLTADNVSEAASAVLNSFVISRIV
jgi:hypothetical protein